MPMRMVRGVPLCAVMFALMASHAEAHGDGRVSHNPGMAKDQMEKENSKLRELVETQRRDLETQAHENAALRQLVERQALETPTMRGRRSSASSKRRQPPPASFLCAGSERAGPR